MNRFRKNSTLAAASLAAFLIVTGCHHKQAAVPEPPPPPAETAPAPTATLTASPESFNAGQSVVLTWHTTDATDVAIDGIGTVEPSGTKTVNPTATTTYHLTARGDGGSTDATATVTLNAAPPPAPAQEMTEAMFEQNVKPIFFDYDSYAVRPDAQATITQDVSFLQAHPSAKILVAGYCDDRGSAEYNLALGQNRANAAKTALTQAGVDASRIRTISYGKEKQFCNQQAESCWQQNRRDQFTLDQ
jgi:peptidoglycan-associated lipoprotein